MKNGAKTKTLVDWQAANDQYLRAAVTWVRLLLEQHAQERTRQPEASYVSPVPSSTSTGSDVVDTNSMYAKSLSTPEPSNYENASEKPKTRRKSRRKAESEPSSSEYTESDGRKEYRKEYQEYGESASMLSISANAHDEQIELAAKKMAHFEARIDPPPALVLLTQRLGLSKFERNVLLLCIAVELDTRIPALCAEVQRNLAKPYPTFSVALAIFNDPAWEALSPERPLRYWRLIEINQQGGQPLTTSALRADERIVNYIKGLNYLDDRLVPLISQIRFDDHAESLPPSQQAAVDAILFCWNQSADRLPAVQLLGPDEPSKRRIASHAAGSLGLHLYRLPIDLIPVQTSDLETLIRLWQREATLLPLALYLEAQEGDLTEAQVAATQRFLSRCTGPVFLAARERWQHLEHDSFSVDVAKPTTMEQCAAWTAELEEKNWVAPELPERLSGQFNFDLATIRHIAREVSEASQDEYSEADQYQALAERLWNASRAHARPRLESLAQRLEPKATWDDIVLPDEETQTLHQIARQVSQRTRVYQEWGFAKKMNRGFGISALFAGESGTGKTMAAEVIANELQLDLYRIDLSAVINKYIGETEKNLRRLFDAAEDGGVILFFDEADALFGKRSEVKDSHDRYANIETNYLLQRIESYRGLAILATNMKGALDSAFMRRVRFIMNFPVPAAAQRKLIWQKVFPSETRTEGLDFDRLARLNLTGGLIHNIALNAAFLAAQNDTPVTMPLVLTAARAEFRKLDKPINEGDFRLLEQAAAVTGG
jgi:hypothetical protein